MGRGAYTEEEVRAFLSPGISRAKVDKQFGRAPIKLPAGEGREIAIYSFQVNDSGAFQEKFTGFQVRYKDERVEEWFPVYSHQSVQGDSEQTKPVGSPTNRNRKGVSP